MGVADVPAATATGDQRKHLKKANITPIGVAVMLYCLVASGAFGIEEIIPAVGPGATLILLVAFPIIWAGPICSMVAENAALLPVEGGVYEWSKAAFGRFWGFQAAWWVTLDIYIAAGTYVALATGYAGQLLGLSETGEFLAKVFMIIAFAAVNLGGFKDVERADRILAGVIVGVFVLVMIVGFGNAQANPFDPLISPYADGASISEGIFLCIWMYCGFESIASMGGEFSDPTAIPRGVKIALPLIALSYILPTAAGLAGLPAGSWELWGVYNGPDAETYGYATVLSTVFGDLGAFVFLPVAVISECAIYNTFLASGSRIQYVLACDGMLPRQMTSLSEPGKVPYVGIITISISALIFSQLEFTELVELESVFILATYVILSATTLKLRRLYPSEKRREAGLFVTPGGVVGIVVRAVLPTVIASGALLISEPSYFNYGLAMLASGAVAYPLFKRLFRRKEGVHANSAHDEARPLGLELNPPAERSDVANILIMVGILALYSALKGLLMLLGW